MRDIERLVERYYALFGQTNDFREISRILQKMNDDPDIDSLRGLFCNEYLYSLCMGSARYAEKPSEAFIAAKQLFIAEVSRLPQDPDYDYYRAVACFYKHDHTGCIKWLEKEFGKMPENKEDIINEVRFVDIFVDSFKNAYPGFWLRIADIIKQRTSGDDVIDLCFLLDKYYHAKTIEEAINILQPFVASHSDLILPKELLAFSYLDSKMWNNALSCFDLVLEKTVLFYQEDVYFSKAWCYDKLRDLKNAETWYRKCIDVNAGYPNVLNNLGYNLYRQKRYDEALVVLDRCLKENLDTEYAANNYVRTLLATGQYETAQQFIQKKKYKIASAIRKKVEQHAPINEKRTYILNETTEDDIDAGAQEHLPDLGIKKQQFSSEKVLEDELTARIESGHDVFGKKLKIYNRIGDFYGRQYMIANGQYRIDILCEDQEGNLYVIELKKDKGYGDPYEQVKNYMEWIQKNRCKEEKKTYGIICLNSPTERLVKAVRDDPMVSLYEYQIMYREIK